jgi:hypothetical protein
MVNQLVDWEVLDKSLLQLGNKRCLLLGSSQAVKAVPQILGHLLKKCGKK